jgi:hypothetical protein
MTPITLSAIAENIIKIRFNKGLKMRKMTTLNVVNIPSRNFNFAEGMIQAVGSVAYHNASKPRSMKLNGLRSEDYLARFSNLYSKPFGFCLPSKTSQHSKTSRFLVGLFGSGNLMDIRYNRSGS